MTGRRKSIDAMRVMAIIAVIAIHTTPFEDASTPLGGTLDLALVINQLARFAVPFFFVMAGYFWATKFSNERELYRPTFGLLTRLLKIFVFWSLVYIFPTDLDRALSMGSMGVLKQAYWNALSAVGHPTLTLLQGTKVHLWFLMGLVSALLISAVLLRFGLERLLVTTALVLYLLGLLGKAYADTPIGWQTGFNFRNGPFFSLIFFVIGFYMQRWKLDACPFPTAVLVVALGGSLHFLELVVLNRLWGVSMAQDYVFGTIVFGVGAAQVALSNARCLQFSWASGVGVMVLGVYASHLVFVDMLRPLDDHLSGFAWWGVAYVVLVFGLSLATAKVLSGWRLTRDLVS